ncbi:MAG: ABC-2 transporter permease, partial [Coriobacteriales bacterium]|nr:ABC-2 transporter permease [Coriobacteriales bacterium]
GSMFTVMMVFYSMLTLFGNDEAGDWEQMRLTLPVTPRLVVRERYAFLALTGMAIAAIGTAAGVLVNVGLSIFVAPSTPGVLEVIGGAFGSALIALAYMALIMPYVFKVGIAKARMTFSLPFILCLLINVGPVRDVTRGFVNSLERLEHTLGSPAPIFAVIVLVAVALYAASMLIAERTYARRDF